MSKPTILVVPGSFAPAAIYQDVVDLLYKKGYPAVTVQLPSTQKRWPLPPATMEEDAQVIRGAVEGLVKLGREVIVICHSYGGTPTTQALCGLPIKRLIYLTAAVPSIGHNQITALDTNPAYMPPATEGYMHVDALGMASAVVNDLPWEKAYPLALLMPHHSRVSFDGVVTKVVYGESGAPPVTYVRCEKDLIISPEKQGEMIERLKGAGVEVRVESLECGHCPIWSMPGELVEVIVRNAEL